MKLIGKVALTIALFAGGLGLGTMLTSNADGGLIDPNAPGTANDPIVTKSYVDEAIKKITGQDPAPAQQVPNSSKLTVIELISGQRLVAGEGAEFIVRTGKALAFSSDESGIPDLTEGKDLKAGTVVPLNHLLLFPREGRGIQPHKDEKNTIYVMVRGPYSHWDKDGTLLNK